MYTLNDPKKRAVGFKLSEDMAIPKELEGKFKFARQKSKLAGTIRGSFFCNQRRILVLKGSIQILYTAFLKPIKFKLLRI